MTFHTALQFLAACFALMLLGEFIMTAIAWLKRRLDRQQPRRRALAVEVRSHEARRGHRLIP